jgi:hypothetical protein
MAVKEFLKLFLEKKRSAPKAGFRSLSQRARSSYSAKNGRATQSGLRPCRNRSAMTFPPRACGTSLTPSTCTLPEAHDMLGPRTVRQTPLTCR